MDLTKLSTADLEAIAAGDLSRVSSAGLRILQEVQTPAAPRARFSGADTARAFGQGALGGIKALTDVFGAGNAASNVLEAGSTKLQEGMSAGRKAEMAAQAKRMQAAEASGDVKQEAMAGLSSFLEAPLQTTAQGLGSIVPFAATSVAGAAAKFLPGTIKVIQTMMGAGMGAGAVKGSIYDAVYKQNIDDGKSPAVAHQQAEEAQTYVGKNTEQIALGTGLGALAARTGAEKLLVPGAEKGLAASAARRVGRAVAEEVPMEAAQGGQERLAANLALQREGVDVPTFRGVAGQAVQEGLTAGVAAAPIAAYRSPRAALAEQERAAETKRLADAEAAQQAELEAKRADPNYLQNLAAQSDDYAGKIKALDDAMQAAKPKKGAPLDPVAVAAGKQARVERDALLQSPEYEAFQRELQQSAPDIQAMQAKQAQDAADQATAAKAEQEAKLADPALQTRLHTEFDALTGQMVDVDKQLDAAIRSGDADTRAALDKQYAELEAQREALQAQLGPRPTAQTDAAVQSVEDMQARLAKLVGTTTKNGFPKAGEIMKARRDKRMDDYAALTREADELRQKIAEPTRARDAVQRQIDEYKARTAEQPTPAPAEPAAPAPTPAVPPENLSPEAAKQWLLDRKDAARDAQRTPLNPNFTAQRELPLKADPVQFTSAATVQRREQTLEDLKNEFGALVRSARVQRVQGRVPRELQERITAKADEIRDFQSAVARQGVPRGQATAEMAADLAGTRVPDTLPRGQNVERVKRVYTPEKASEEAVQKQLNELPEKLAPQDEGLVGQITRALPALRNAGMPAETMDVPSIEGVPYDRVTAELAPTRALDDVAAYLYKLRTGADATTEAAQVQEHLARLEQGKRSEDTGTVPYQSAVQEDMFQDTELQGTIFGTYAEFEKYLAGDAVKEARAAVGQTLATAARLQRDIAPMQAELGRLRAQLTNLQELQAFVISAGDASVEKAQAKHQAAVDALRDTAAAIEAKLGPQEKALEQAMQQLYAAVAVQAKVSDAIAKNTAKFNRDADVQAAAAKLASTQAAHAAALQQATTTGKASFNRTNALYNNVVESINEYRTTLEQNLKQNNKTPERSLLAFLNRDMELVLRLRDAEQTAEKARAAVDAARETRDSAYEALQNAPETQEALRAAARGISTAQGVLTKARNRAVTARTREAQAVAAVSDEAQELQRSIAEKTKPVQAARDARVAPPLEEKKTQREDRDNAARKEEQERAERLQAIPGVQVTNERMRDTLAEAERLPERIRALDAAAKDETKSQAARNKAKYEAKDLRDRAKILYGTISNDPELSQAAATALDTRITDLQEKIEAKRTAINEPGKAASTIRSRRKELAEMQTDMRSLKRMRKTITQRANFAPVGTNKTSTRALADQLEAVQDKLVTTEDPKSKDALQKQADRLQAELDRRDEAEQRLALERGINLETEGTTGKLPARVVGPVVKKAVQAANIRTGEASTVGERMAGSQNKAVQSGRKKGVTGAQAVKQAAEDVAHEQALLKLSEIEDIQERNDAALERARTAKDTPRVEKLEANAKRLKEALVVAQKRVDETASIEPEVSTLDDDVASQFRSDRQTTEVDDDVVIAVQDGRMLDVAKLLAARGSTPEVRARAEKLIPMLMRTKIGVQDTVMVDGKSVAGKFDPGTNTITMAPGGINEEDLLHEMSHAATDRTLLAPDSTLTDDQRAAKRELEGMRKMVAGNPAFASEDIDNVREFAAEVYSNESLRQKLDNIGKPLTLYQRFKNLVSRLLGWSTPDKPLSKKAEELVDRIMQPSRALNKADAPALAPAASQWRAPKKDTTSALGKMSSMITAEPTNPMERLLRNAGLSIEMWGADMRAPLMKALSVAGEKTLTQAAYYVRKADALMNHVYASLSHGPLQLVKTSKGNFEIKAGNGPSMRALLDAVKDIKGVSPEDKMDKLQAYMASQRAARVGWDKLNFSKSADLQKQAAAVNTELATDPAQKAALENARQVYNQINKGTVEFLAASGYISKAKAAELLQYGDYVPFYRVKANGIAELVMGETAVIHVGDLRKNKFLAPLVGDSEKLLPLNESIVRNTMLLTDMAMRNLATKDVAYALQKIGAGRAANGRNVMPIHKNKPPQGDGDIITFRQEPDPADDTDTGERWLRVRTQGTAAEHIPADMLVQSLEGSFSTLPAGLKAASWFGDLLRAGVTRNPMYIARQLIRDPLAAAFTGGLEAGITKSVFKSLANYVEQTAGRSKAGDELALKGLTQSGIFTGDIDDINKMMLQITAGDQGAMQKMMAWWDKAAMNADAATRIQMFKDAQARGLDPMEAEFAAMEMMNFNKRGLSPTVQYAARMVPFLNAQIQGLNVLYKAATGNMPQNEKLAIKEKFYRRAVTMALFTMAYAMAMEDDETYKTALPRDRYSNWIIPNPFGGESFKLPIPFEVGLLFKALPEALVDAMRGDFKDEEFKAIRQAFTAQIPGGSSYGLPQAIKPTIELVTNHNFFTGREIESRSDLGKASAERFGAGTTEIAKETSQILNAMGIELSPKQLDHLVSGYLGSVPVMVARLTNSIFAGTDAATRPTERASDSPIYGALFQRTLGGGPVDAAYAHEEALSQAKRTYDSMNADGRKADAEAYKEDVLNVLGSPELAKAFKSKIDLLQKADKAARVQIKDPDALRARLDELERQKNATAKMYLDAVRQIAR